MRFSFLFKALIAAALVMAFDRLLPVGMAGAVVGAFATAWLIGLVTARTDVRHDHRACVALAAAALFVTSLIDDPGLLGCGCRSCGR